MSDTRITAIFAGVAVVLALMAFITAPRPVEPDAFFDQGEPFFPEFTNPNDAKTLEVVDFDEESGTAVPFKVTFQQGRWTIPSHHDYPADGKDRLAKTAAGVIEVKKDDFRTDNTADFEACGVIDPLDETATSLTGRGKRITIKGENDKILADLIIGKEVPERENMRFVRLPGQKRVFAARVDLDISTRFSDWIEADLLKVEKDKINRIVFKDYSIDERTGVVNQRDNLVLDKDGSDWKLERMASNEEVDRSKMTTLLTTIDDLSIVGVRPKPAGLSAGLRMTEAGVSISQQDAMSLQSKGYFFARNGQLLSNEGEIQAKTEEGVRYILRFGEVVFGSGAEVSAGVDLPDGEQRSGPAENRYLFITADFIADDFPEPTKPANTDFLNKADSLWSDADHRNKELHDKHQEWQKKIETGRKKVEELNDRFADWYYVISSESFEKLRLKREDLVKKKES